MPKVNIEISARHVHLSEEHFIKLFGEEIELTKLKDLSQKGEFASDHKVDLQVGENKIERVRVLGPFRKQTQVEISLTDARELKTDVPLKISGDLSDSASVSLLTGQGRVDLEEGMIIAKRHLHVSPAEAEGLSLEEGQEVGLRVESERAGELDKIVVRIKDTYTANVHLDTDEANALGVKEGDEGELISK